MSTVFVKLRDRGSVFHDNSQDYTVTGEAVHEVKLTSKIETAIRHGVLTKVDAPAKAEVAPTVETPTQEPTKETTEATEEAETTEEPTPVGESTEAKDTKSSKKK